MRGKVGKTIRNKRITGITPACAGKSAFSQSALPYSWDHPRVRGEKGESPRPSRRRLGSPPRARGKADRNRIEHQQAGITPACAGKRSRSRRTRSSCRDHPRVRGEKYGARRMRKSKRGSPPRARGKELQNAGAVRIRGITPACAGKSGSPCSGRCRSRDHPRMRGEKGGWIFDRLLYRGSPPHARGKVASFAQ